MPAIASATVSVGHEAADQGVGLTVDLRRRSISSVSSMRVVAGRGGDVHQLLDVPAGRLGAVGGHVEAAGHPFDVTQPISI